MTSEQLNASKENLNALVCHCVDTLVDEHPFRIVYALQTLAAVIQSMYKKANQGDYGFNLIDILVGFDSAEQRMTTLMQHCNNFLTGRYIIINNYIGNKKLLIICISIYHQFNVLEIDYNLSDLSYTLYYIYISIYVYIMLF